MNPHNIAALINILGFVTGAALYAMLLVMLLRAADPLADHSSSLPGNRSLKLSTKRLLLITALLGLLWNLGALVIYGARDWSVGRISHLFEVAVFSALGFLPAVVVNTVLMAGEDLARRAGARVITIIAYALSAAAAIMHFYSASVSGATPSAPALRMLTIGFSGLTIALVVYTRRSSIWKRALWVVALAVFAVSALHLSQHTSGEERWFIELIGHHASLPLVIAMLYQDYRFALADIFLKRALALVVLVAISFGLYVVVAAPLLKMRDSNEELDARAVGILIALWVGIALIYPFVRRTVVWFVDAVVLRRANYHELRDELARIAASSEDPREILDKVCLRLTTALTASEVSWRNQTSLRRTVATVPIPTHEPPSYSLSIGELSGGRKLLSDDIALLESVAIMLARRIDVVRITHERCERNLREQEIGKLATEAELRALRAQLNPHFLFNALTTISYLIQTAPERALETMMRLTGLLRAVLRAPTEEFVTVDEEIELIESYLAIERARFEERLRITIDVPLELRRLRIPPLIVQPLVENAIKHGIAPGKNGGTVMVQARVEDNLTLCMTVRDTGVGISDIALAQKRTQGVGLANVEKRLDCLFGPDASVKLMSEPGRGTVVEIRMPVDSQSEPLAESQRPRDRMTA